MALVNRDFQLHLCPNPSFPFSPIRSTASRGEQEKGLMAAAVVTPYAPSPAAATLTLFPPPPPQQQEEKRKPKAFGLRTFADPGCPVDFTGAFRDNVREFLRECGDVEDYTVEGMPVWATLLVDERTGAAVPLYTVEEAVKHSTRPFCDHCRCSGWSHHFVSKRRYHFIIPVDDQWDEPLHQNAFDYPAHLLHGLIHCNGFGHLLSINGREGGSHHVRGQDIMNLWDRICTSLRAREVTVEDMSRKRSMELRLLYGVAYGITWFGRWDYRFHVGSFGVKEDAFAKSIDLIATQDLDGLIEDFQKIGRERELNRIISTYRKQNPRLTTVRNLLRFLLDLKNRPDHLMKVVHGVYPVVPKKQWRTVPGNSKAGKKRAREFDDVAAELDSRWSTRRLRGAADVVVDSLQENGGVLTRQELRDTARLTIGDTGLLDFVLKSLGDCVVGCHVVRRTQNPLTRVLEFTLEDATTPSSDMVAEPEPQAGPGAGASADADAELSCVTACVPPVIRTEKELRWNSSRAGQSHVDRDIVWVYRNVLLRGKAGETVLQGKRWVKMWPLRDEEDDQLRFLCRWLPSEIDARLGGLTRPLPPPEVVVMPPHSAVVELRIEAEKALRDTYCVMENFVATKLDGVRGEEWDPLFGAVESGAVVWVEGMGVDAKVGDSLARYEGGADNWTVDCPCSATDDDGERMVSCDVCEVWQHTRCAGINDGEVVPRLFLCERCSGTVITHHHTDLII